ncbi:unnamed protein product [Anisakis simplex]|uniref:Velvet domain-containing protein n=1 Tax=Anisakis simplex TaxID=6269 RepID=A0A0M3KFF2_ANISI|nr:unnamed protein product [Anisakis simplex]
MSDFLRYHRDSSTSSVTSTEEEECVERCLKRRNLTSAWTSSTDIATDLSDITTSANNNNSNTLSSLSSPSSSNSNSSSSAFCVFQRKKRKLSRCRIADYSCFPMMSDSQAPHQSQQQQSCSSSAPLFTRARYQFDTSIISRHFNGYNNIINHTNNDDHPPISEHLSYNKRIVFIKRPVLGENNFPTVDCFHCEECPAPNQSDVDDGQCIIRTLFLSVDPAQVRVDYLEPFEPGELVDGLEGIGVVEMASPASVI